MQVTVLASGSRGNVTLVEAGGRAILLDAGIDPTAVRRQMQRAGVSAKPDALVLTHAHSDHTRYAAELAVAFGLTVYATEATRRRLPIRSIPKLRAFGAREPFAVGDVTVTPLPLPHDAPQVSLKLSHQGRAVAIATDLGEVPPALPEHLRGCDVVLLESNHDLGMLWRGPYPYNLKRRIASAHGHLSNGQAHDLLRALDRAVRAVVLMHLSEANNRPELARDLAADALSEHPAQLLVSSQTGVTRVDVEALRSAGAATSPTVTATATTRGGAPAQLDLFAPR